MPEFDLDAALASPDGPPVFVYTQEVFHRGEPVENHTLMFGPDEQGRATAVALLSVSGSGWVNLRWFGAQSRWRRMRSPDELETLGQQEVEIGATARHQHAHLGRGRGGLEMPVGEWWRKVGGQSA